MRTRAKGRGVLLLTVLVIASGAFAALAGTAGAVIVKLADGRTVSYLPPVAGGPLAAPFARANTGAGTAKMTYHGGPVMPATRNFMFLWAPGGLASYPAGYVEGLERYFHDLAHDSGGTQNVESVAAQYGDGEGNFSEYSLTFGGAIVDESPYPANGCTAAPKCLTEAQLSSELRNYVQAHALPTGLRTAYFILTPPKVESCFESNSRECSAGSSSPEYCAFHGYTESAGSPIVFGVDPYAVGIEGCDLQEHPSGLASEGEIQGGLSHEHAEMVTDPELNAWYASNGEIGDKCRTFESATEFGAPLGTAENGSKFNQLINGDEYLYQQEWSNEIVGCAQRRSIGAPSVSVVAPKSGAAIGGNTVVINGTGFQGVSEVRFGSVASPEVKVVNSGTIEAVVPAGTSGTVQITVVAEGGSSGAVKGARYKYGPPTVASVAPAGGPQAGGNSVTLTGSGFEVGNTMKVRFGKVVASGVHCVSTTTCAATAPAAGSKGTVDVRVTVGSKSSARVRATDAYTYN